MPRGRQTPPVTLPGALLGLVLIGILIFGGATYVVVRNYGGTFQESALREAVAQRTAGASLAFARALEQDWQNLEAIASDIARLDAEALGAVLDATAGPDQRISWAGFARPDGSVVVASGDMLQGADVSARPWFQRGLQGDFAGDLHEAVLLADLMSDRDAAPPRFLDLSTSVDGPTGRLAGVLGFHINASWAENYLSDMADTLGIDLALVNSSGEVVIGTFPAMTARLGLPSLGAASSGVAGSGYEVWPDGIRYFTAVTPSVTYGELPSFGWRLVGRIDPQSFSSTAGGNLVRRSAIASLFAGSLFLLAGVLFNRLYLRPIGSLARNAERIAEGHGDYPLEIRSSAEIYRLSASLARLEGQRG